MTDEARMMSRGTVAMVTDGQCLNTTLRNLAESDGRRKLSDESQAKVRRDALYLLGDVLSAYDRSVAKGEVGFEGTARASPAPAVSGPCPTGLLYGRVQSGKTMAMIATTAAAIDNGFRVIIVLTSDFVKLVEQTAARFRELGGPIILNSLGSDNWQKDVDHVRSYIAEHGLVIVCAKNQQRLTALVEFLVKIDAADYPALVLDDEADQATLDTTLAARTSGRAKAPTKGSAIHRKTVHNDAPEEQGASIRETLRHHVFIQVTATPYALLLQNIDSELRPQFTRLLEPAGGYTGGEAFFSNAHVEGKLPPLCIVGEDETAQLEDPATVDVPSGLQHAIAFFLVAAAAQELTHPARSRSPQNFLCHTSVKTGEHERLADLIRKYLGHIGEDLQPGRPEAVVLSRLEAAHAELAKTLDPVPPFDAILAGIRRRLPHREVVVVNSAAERVDLGGTLNFIVGGNILGRGLTIENLLVTYYLRRAKVSQMDTVLQHARMFGYRADLMNFTRVFLPEDLAFRFNFIHMSEHGLRGQIRDGNEHGRFVVETMHSLRATRLNVLDTSSLAAFESGQQVYPGGIAVTDAALDRTAAIEQLVRTALGGSLVSNTSKEITTEQAVQLVETLPFATELANAWDPKALAQLLRTLGSRNGGRAYLRYRKLTRSGTRLATGAVSGDELATAREADAPVVFAFQVHGPGLGGKLRAGRSCWYPTVVLPTSMPTQVFNTTT